MKSFLDPFEGEDPYKTIPSYLVRRFIRFERERYVGDPGPLQVLEKLENYVGNVEEPALFSERELATLKAALLVWAADWAIDPCCVSQMTPVLQHVFEEHEPLGDEDLEKLLAKMGL